MWRCVCRCTRAWRGHVPRATSGCKRQRGQDSNWQRLGMEACCKHESRGTMLARVKEKLYQIEAPMYIYSYLSTYPFLWIVNEICIHACQAWMSLGTSCCRARVSTSMWYCWLGACSSIEVHATHHSLCLCLTKYHQDPASNPSPNIWRFYIWSGWGRWIHRRKPVSSGKESDGLQTTPGAVCGLTAFSFVRIFIRDIGQDSSC